VIISVERTINVIIEFVFKSKIFIQSSIAIITYAKTSITTKTKIMKPMLPTSENCLVCSIKTQIDAKKARRPIVIWALVLSCMFFCQRIFLYKPF